MYVDAENQTHLSYSFYDPAAFSTRNLQTQGKGGSLVHECILPFACTPPGLKQIHLKPLIPKFCFYKSYLYPNVRSALKLGHSYLAFRKGVLVSQVSLFFFVFFLLLLFFASYATYTLIN
jgi:hypothetical protein